LSASRPSVVFATAELSPFATTGGLGDVSAALPRALHELGHGVCIFLPLYDSVRRSGLAMRTIGEIAVPGFGDRVPVHVANRGKDEPELYLVEHDGFFRRPSLYGDAFGDYPDNLERFAFFSRAVLEAVDAFEIRADVFHCNDWHTALVGAYRRTLYRERPRLRSSGILFTIHNLAYQGRFPADRLPATILPPSLFRFEWLEFFGQLNLMKAGIVFADAISTVSPGYAAEILTPEYGAGLDAVLRFRREDLHGILNGIDTDTWNPETDPHLAARYGRDDLSGKERCREALLHELRVGLGADAPLVAMVSRLTWQKGSDIVLATAPEILRVGGRDAPSPGFVLLGSGDAGLEKGFRELAERHPGRVGIRIGFDEALAHRIEAGADLFLMPSRYEPSGLNQMYSLRYGTVPVVRACGGLADTVQEVSSDGSSGNGFRFVEPTGVDLLAALTRAFGFFRDTETWRAIARRGMAEDHSWRRSAQEYATLYEDVRRRGSREWTVPL
jgi:starch synthase